jgi:hypothetical protein
MSERLTVTFSVPNPASIHVDLNRSLAHQCLSYQAVMDVVKKLPEKVLFLVSHVGVSLNNHHDEHTIKFVLKGHTHLIGKWETETDTRVLFSFTPNITKEELCDRIHKSILLVLQDRKMLITRHQHEVDDMINGME